MLTLLQEILIYLENAEEPVPFSALKKFGERQARAILGRMAAKGLVEKSDRDGDIAFAISPEGRNLLNRYLGLIHENREAHKGGWYLFAFSIPERQRHLRDRLRRHLREFNFGLVFNNLWLTCRDQITELENLTTKLNIADKVAYFEVSPTDLTAKKIIQDAWDLEMVEKQYREFIQRAQKALPKLDQDPEKKFKIKRLIFTYALVLSADPGLPKKYLPANWPQKQAHEIYIKIRELLF